MTWSLKIKIFVWFPPSVQDFFVICITLIFKRTSLRIFRFKVSQFVPFWIKNPQNLSKICKKGTRARAWAIASLLIFFQYSAKAVSVM